MKYYGGPVPMYDDGHFPFRTTPGQKIIGAPMEWASVGFELKKGKIIGEILKDIGYNVTDGLFVDP